MSTPTLVCLLPVRNGGIDLPGYFESVARFADAVVALDDGSTDATRELLESEPLVKIVISNPRRNDYRGWDDAENRNRLLLAAADLSPTWILSLDADERISPDDAAALRTFIEAEAIPGCAYGFKVHRMWQGLDQYDRAGLWVYRLFAFEPGQRFPDQRLHFVPIPTTIPRTLWLRTTIRIQHLASLTEERRHARFAKYQEADPSNEFQHTYRDLLAEAVDLQPWEPRPPHLPVLELSDAGALDLPGDDLRDRPSLTAVIISRDDEQRITRTVQSVVEQECPWPVEVIVVTSGTDRTAEIVRERFPQVTLIELPRPALPGEARNAGVLAARGDYVSFPGSHVELPPGSLAARLRAHDRGYAMVTGTTLNGTTTRSGWASYFLDHSASLPGRPSGELRGAPGSCSYSREALLELGGFPEDLRAGEDTVVNRALSQRGYVAYRAQDVTLIHHSPCRTPWDLVRHHFVRGRGWGRILRDEYLARGRPPGVPIARSLLRRQVLRRLTRITRNVRAWGGSLVREYWRVFPLVIAGAIAAWLGTRYELLRSSVGRPPMRRPGWRAVLTASPNPVPSGDGPGTTTIAWSTDTGSVGEVFVAEDDGPERFVARGAEGVREVNGLTSGVRYEFRLYAGLDQAVQLASVTVTREDIPWETIASGLRTSVTQEERRDDVAHLLGDIIPPLLPYPHGTQYFHLWESRGFHVTRAHYYYPIPDTRQLPERLWTSESELVGIDMNDADQLDLLTRRFPSFREEFGQFPPEPSDKTPQFYLNNPWFGGIDALALYCMVREFRPQRVLEVGSGFSTRVSLQAALRNENTRLICIEPYPDDPIRHDVLKQDHHGLVSVIRKKVQEVDLSQFKELVSGDILFIDSTHVSKIGSDVNYLVLEVLPRLNPGVIVHFHDIFLPEEYPREWVVHQRRFFNEQYLLHAFLACNATYSVLLANHYFGRKYQASLRKVFPNSPDWEGTSFWIRRRAT